LSTDAFIYFVVPLVQSASLPALYHAD